ncbi:hypothetical protein pdam_00015949 [Pocillopora damicornis]|uniref:Uncharacterized protein n=1 Tax=Pocillopora damicornis TaxID=46731 RepID=A0A3M6THD1_POCDA|nr:hypothetical protein pdam_00015949 [Pocillopora damicornis]
MIMGSVNTKVFPEPVNAIPIMSLPVRTAGMPWICIGVGCVMPFFFSVFRTARGNFISLKVLMGGGGYELK